MPAGWELGAALTVVRGDVDSCHLLQFVQSDLQVCFHTVGGQRWHQPWHSEWLAEPVCNMCCDRPYDFVMAAELHETRLHEPRGPRVGFRQLHLVR